MPSLFSEREKNIRKSQIIINSMIFLALLIPAVVYFISGDLLITFIMGILALLYIKSVENGIDTTFSSLKAIKVGEKEGEKNIKIKQYRNLVEELRISANYRGTIETYIIKHPSINAMAVSKGNKAAIAITTGALEKLNREELSGVIGHEISHIANGDSDLKLAAYITMGVLLTYASFVLRNPRLFLSGGRDRKGGGGVYLFLIALLLSILGYVLSMLMFYMLSREREKLADVEAVRFTRNKYALIKALEKIKSNEKMEVSTTASALFFANPLNPLKSEVFSGLFRTHPPLEERIEYLKKL